jgi:hypothetical protein
VELVDQARDVVDVTAGRLRNIHVRYLTRCDNRMAADAALRITTTPT